MGSVYSFISDSFAQNPDALQSDILKNEAESENRREQTNTKDIPDPDRSTEETEQDLDNNNGSQIGTGDSKTVSPMAFDDELQDVDQMNLVVRYDGGKQLDIDVFPLEKAQTLLDNVCQQAMKDPKKMHLVYQGEPLDVKMTVHECKLKRGHSIILARKP